MSEFSEQKVGDRTVMVGANGQEFQAILVAKSDAERKYQIDDEKMGDLNGAVIVCQVQQ